MMNFSGAEFVIILFLALVLIGPERMPYYAQQLAKFVRNFQSMLTGAKSTLKEELGDDYAELAKFDPRQYDPRKIVRDALIEDVVPSSRQATNARRAPSATPAPGAVQGADGSLGSDGSTGTGGALGVGGVQGAEEAHLGSQRVDVPVPFDDEAT